MGKNIYIDAILCNRYCAFGTQLGILDAADRNAIVHERCTSIRYQKERPALFIAIPRNVIVELLLQLFVGYFGTEKLCSIKVEPKTI